MESGAGEDQLGIDDEFALLLEITSLAIDPFLDEAVALGVEHVVPGRFDRSGDFLFIGFGSLEKLDKDPIDARIEGPRRGGGLGAEGKKGRHDLGCPTNAGNQPIGSAGQWAAIARAEFKVGRGVLEACTRADFCLDGVCLLYTSPSPRDS